jgi:hypothetical protein
MPQGLFFGPTSFTPRLRSSLHTASTSFTRIDYNAFIVTITRSSRAIDYRDSVATKSLRELIDEAFRTRRDREMGQSQSLNAGSEFGQR